MSADEVYSPIINPFPIFPSWPIKGKMISSQNKRVSAIPKLIMDKYKIPSMLDGTPTWHSSQQNFLT